MRYALVALICMSGLVCGCRDNPPATRAPQYSLTHVNRAGSPVKCSNYFTWTGYHGRGRNEDAVFIWNGEVVGKGDEGAKAVLKKMAVLPLGASVLIFPSYTTDEEAAEGGEVRYMPFDYRPVHDIAEKRNLAIVISPFDNNGILHPDEADSSRPE